MVSHELRAPLTAIKGSAATLLEEAPELEAAEMHEFFRIIHEQAGHMRSLIGALLDAGRIEAGTLSVSPEPSEVAALVDRARNTFISGGGRHTVRIDLPPDLPRVMADRRRVVQVLNNLLSNAARHSPESAPVRGRGRARRRPRRGLGVRRRRAAASRPSCCPDCSASTPSPTGRVRARSPETASGSSSARGWWKRMGAGSGPKATVPVREACSPSPCRRWRTPVTPTPTPSRPARERVLRRGAREARERRPHSGRGRRPEDPFATCATS